MVALVRSPEQPQSKSATLEECSKLLANCSMKLAPRTPTRLSALLRKPPSSLAALRALKEFGPAFFIDAAWMAHQHRPPRTNTLVSGC
jgi:hypothetical protein